jgi:uncharacterized protein (TIGR03083 family)
MDTIPQMIAALEASRQAMQPVVDACDPQREIYPGWTMKEVLAHIAGWDEMTKDLLLAHGRGIDGYNARSVAARQSLTYAQTVSDWQTERSALTAALHNLPPEKLPVQMPFPWKMVGLTEDLIGIMVHHEREHADEIRGLFL